MKGSVVILDYGMGNLNSVKKKIDRLHAKAIVSSKKEDILNADKIILPGVGHFKKAMSNLKQMDLIDTLNEAVMVHQKPILGICLGMQLMAKTSEEGNCEGLGWFDAKVVKFNINNTLKHKVPHMGWNQIIQSKESRLMTGLPENASFYFVHAYHLETTQKQDVLNETDYEYRFISAIEKNNIFGVQYHPEKSHDDGELLLKNFITL